MDAPKELHMSDPFIGEIRMFAGNFAPNGWAYCNGQLMTISENDALFALIGTAYGGDGQTTFALPDLGGRIPVGQGQGPGLTNRILAQQYGSENVTLLSTQMPAHTHTLIASGVAATTSSPNGSVVAAQPDDSVFIGGVAPTVVMRTDQVAMDGGDQPHDNMAPYLGLNFIIALVGIFPSQS
jgi:microcystin-dependent protein